MKRSILIALTLIATCFEPVHAQEDRWERGRREEISIGISPSFAGIGFQGKSVFEIKEKWQIGVFASVGLATSIEYAVGADLYFLDRFYLTLGVGPLAVAEVPDVYYIGNIPIETTEWVSYYGFYQMLNYDIRISNSFAIHTGIGYGFAFDDVGGEHLLTSIGLKYTYVWK